MDYKREITIGVHLDRFKNIELFKQGLYQVRIRVSYELDNAIHFVQPVKMWNISDKLLKKNCNNILPAHILDEFSCFNTRVLLVRYQEETVNILESCIFSCRIPNRPQPLPAKIHADLYFTNLETKNSDKSKFRLLCPDPVFECIVSKEYIITDIFSPLSHYFPMSFDPKCFCCLDGMVHIYTSKICDLSLGLRYKLFGNSNLAGGSKIDRAYFSIIDPLYLGYNNILKVLQELSDSSIIPEDLIPPKVSLPLSGDETGKKTFHETVESHSVVDVTIKIISELESFSEIVTRAIEKLILVTTSYSNKISQLFRTKFNREVWQHFQEYIQIEEISNSFSTIYESKEFMDVKASQIRDCSYFNNLETISLQAEDLYKVNSYHPIFFIQSENTHIKTLIEDRIGKSVEMHLMFLVHGYRGSSMDMHMIKGYINMIYPSVHVHSVKNNENYTDNSIDVLGDNLAEEILQYIHQSRVPKHRLKISFIGHSLGGLILRAALLLLKDYKSCMHSFITFSSPHVGIVYFDSLLLKVGKWALSKFQKSTSFHQMTMTDKKPLKDSYIYKLSECEGLDWFKHVVMLSCSDDPYVPIDSAGLYIPPLSIGTKKEKVFEEIVKNILNQIQVDKLIRISVNFKHKEILDACMCYGNRHIDFLDDPCFIKMFCYSFPGIFYTY